MSEIKALLRNTCLPNLAGKYKHVTSGWYQQGSAAIGQMPLHTPGGKGCRRQSGSVIAAVVIGGSLNGGEGSIIGSLAGAVIMTLIRAGCSQMGLPNWAQKIVTGDIIVAAVTLDRLRHRRQ